MDKILVVIVTYNAMQWIERCLASVVESEKKADLFIVDNGSTDGTQEYIKNKYPDVSFIQSPDNMGFGRANNMGLEYALKEEYDYVYLLNQDAWIFPDTLTILTELCIRHPEYGILSPFQMSADVEHIDQGFSHRLRGWPSYFDIIDNFYNNKARDIYRVENVMAAHWLITKKCLKEVGGFSPSFPHYGEDDNYCARTSYKGLMIGVVPSARVVHDRAWREDSVEKKIYKGYITSIYKISCPTGSVLKNYMYSYYIALINMISYKSIKPFVYLWKFNINIRKFLINRKISMYNDGAFLKQEV